MYRWVIFVLGARTMWTLQLHDGDIIASGTEPWRWFARMRMLSVWRQLDPLKCGFALLLPSGEVVEQYDPPPEEVEVVPT